MKSHNFLPAAVAAAGLAILVAIACEPMTLKQKIIDKVVPESPTDLLVEAIGDAQAATVRLSWKNRADDATEIRIEVSSTSASSGFSVVKTIGPGETSLDLSEGLAFGTTYYFRVGAANAVGPSWSAVVSVKTLAQLSDQEAVSADYNLLAIGFSGTDSESSVTRDVSLPSLGSVGGSSIAWAQTSPASPVFISASGVVTPPGDGDKSVTLTATITRGASSLQKVFVLKLLQSDSGAVALDKSSLAIGYGNGDSATSVTGNLTLPTASANGCVISWQSSVPTTVSSAGLVTRSSSNDVTVSLIATISRGNAIDQKQFSVTVKITDAGAVDGEAAYLATHSPFTFQGTDGVNSVTQDFSLVILGLNGTTITWASSAAAVVDTTTTPGTAKVSRPDYADATVSLTATVTKNGVTSSNHPAFDLVVIKAPISDADRVAADKAALQVGYASGDSSTSVSQNVTLATTGPNGCTISWAQTSPVAPVIVSSTGTVTRQSSDLTVQITATITRNSSSDTKVFGLRVLQSDAGAVAEAKAALEIGYTAPDTASSVTQNLALATSGLRGTAISWSTDASSVVDAQGNVTRQASGDTSVLLTATISKNAASDTKAFTVTVVQSAAGIASDLASAKSALEISYTTPDTAASVTSSMSLPATGLYGTAVSWSSDTPTVVSSAGVVTRPDPGNASVRLTATLSKRGSTLTKSFDLTVIQSVTGSAADVAAAKAGLDIGYASPDSASSVTQDLTLPATIGAGGTVITWSQAAPASPVYVTSAGVVTRPAVGLPDATVTLVATISKNGITDSKGFTLTIKAVAQSRLYMLSGTSWVALTSPSSTAISLAESGNSLYAVTAAGTMHNYDGGWHALGAGYSMPGIVCMASWSGTVQAVGSDMKVYCIDGAGWKYAGFSAPSGTVSIAGAGTALYALAGNLIYSWDGGSWQSIGAPASPVSIAARDTVLLALDGTGYIHLYDGGWSNKLPVTAPTGFTEIGGGASNLYVIAYQ